MPESKSTKYLGSIKTFHKCKYSTENVGTLKVEI